jgi:hypothetical protein
MDKGQQPGRNRPVDMPSPVGSTRPVAVGRKVEVACRKPDIRSHVRCVAGLAARLGPIRTSAPNGNDFVVTFQLIAQVKRRLGRRASSVGQGMESVASGGALNPGQHLVRRRRLAPRRGQAEVGVGSAISATNSSVNMPLNQAMAPRHTTPRPSAIAGNTG